MKEHYSVVLMFDAHNCAVKQISKNTYDQIKDMQARGQDDETIVKSLTEINTMEDNIVINGVTIEEAEHCARDEGQDYVVLQAFTS
jgi:cobalamin biosynthesis Co2+ chelatase CbiK